MVRNANWGVIATISPQFKSPFGIVQSFADGPGPKDKASGTPYFYIAKMSTLYLVGDVIIHHYFAFLHDL